MYIGRIDIRKEVEDRKEKPRKLMISGKIYRH